MPVRRTSVRLCSLAAVCSAAFASGCGERIWHGDAIVLDNEAGLETLRGYTEIEGDLWIRRTRARDLEALYALRRVHGEIAIAENSELLEASLPSLEQAGLVRIAGNLSLRTTQLDAL